MTTATHYTREQAKDHYIAAMGEDLGCAFYALWQEVVWLHNEWDEYVQLFGTKPSRITLMNKAAPRFFRMVQDELMDAVVIRIARLTDPPKSTGKSNLSIQQLPLLIKNESFSKEVLNIVTDALKAAEFCRTRRHRRIAHTSLDLALEVLKEPLPNLTRDNINAAIVSLAKVLNAVSFHYVKSTTAFDVVSNPGGAQSLLRIVEYGLAKKEERMAALQRAELPRDEDL